VKTSQHQHVSLHMSSIRQVFGVAVTLLLIAEERAVAEDVKVNGAAELRAALAAAKPGTRLLLAGGNYGAGFHFSNVRGEEKQPIIIMAADAQKPPVFRDGSAGMHFSNPAYVELHNLVFTKLAHNGINIDDVGGKTNGSARGVLLRGLRISDVGSEGNHDGIKLSGIWDFRVTGCTIERWGTRGGSAIDMVGCHRGTIEGNAFRHNPEPQNCSGVQGKGGTSDIVIRRNRFEHAGGRAVNIGGSTGLQFFRPALVEGGEHAEARNLRVEGNTFIGSTPVAFVGVDGAVVRFNTIERPNRWALRILQETKAPGFVACRNGEFSDNTIVFDSTRWSEGGVNIGAGTAPDTFKFARNWWYCADDPKRSRPRLPTAEVEGKYGQPIAEAKGRAGADALP
jgi:parallel beta helix pectate lyase-like protein